MVYVIYIRYLKVCTMSYCAKCLAVFLQLDESLQFLCVLENCVQVILQIKHPLMQKLKGVNCLSGKSRRKLNAFFAATYTAEDVQNRGVDVNQRTVTTKFCSLPLHKQLCNDPLGRPTVTAGSDHCFCTCRPFVRPSVRPHFSKQNKFKAKTMFTTGETVGLAKWIINDICLVFCLFYWPHLGLN